MTQKKREITISLPECVADMPVRVIRKGECSEIIVEISSANEDRMQVETIKPKYAFVWGSCSHHAVALDDIEWIEADGSYSRLHLTGKRSLIISFNLAVVGRKLPKEDFIQIHRSYIVNLRHVKGKIGNSLNINGTFLSIGRGYKEALFSRFLFLHIERKHESFRRDEEKSSL